MSCSSAASRSSRGSVPRPPRTCAGAHPCAGGPGLAPDASPGARAGTGRRGRTRPASRARRRRRRPPGDGSSSPPIRSAETMSRRAPSHPARRGPAAPGRSPAAPRTARRGPSGGVVTERDLGIEGGVERACRQGLHPFVRVDETAVGQPDRHRVDREVATGQVGLDVVAEGHRGLAVLLGVDLFAERRDLEQVAVFQAPTVPNRTPTRYRRSDQPRRTAVVSRGRARAEVPVASVRPSRWSRTPPTRYSSCPASAKRPRAPSRAGGLRARRRDRRCPP